MILPIIIFLNRWETCILPITCLFLKNFTTFFPVQVYTLLKLILIILPIIIFLNRWETYILPITCLFLKNLTIIFINFLHFTTFLTFKKINLILFICFFLVQDYKLQKLIIYLFILVYLYLSRCFLIKYVIIFINLL